MDSEHVLEDTIKEEEKTTKEVYLEIEIPLNLYQYLHSEHCDVQNICRICLATDNEVLYPLVSTKEDNILASMFTALNSIQLYDGDGLPSSICAQCQTQLLQCYEFKIKCEKSDCMLKSILTEGLISNPSILMNKEETTVNNNKDETKEERIILDGNCDIQNELETLADEQCLEVLGNNSDDDNLYIVQSETAKRRVKVYDDKHELKSKQKTSRLRKKPGSEEKSFRCKICSKVFHNAKSFHSHVKNKHPSFRHPHACNQCTESFNSEHDLAVHASVHTKGNTWKCNQCPKEFNTRSTLRRHISRHMECKRYSCESCDKTFTELYALRRHARVHTGESVEKKHACTMCDKRYSESGLLAAHMSRHIGLRPCECSICGKRFPSNRLLTSHRLIHSDRKPYACQYCDKRFRHESTRNTHHRTHTGEKPYVCTVCGKRFIQASNHTLHMRTHTGERPYTCTICDRKFTSGSSLKSHEQVHSGERPYSCDVCGKKFSRKNLHAHMRKHTDERPYECNFCSKKFVTASRLKEHQRVHTGERPYGCSLCPLTFATKAQQFKHSKTHLKKKKQEIYLLEQSEPVPVVTDRIMFNKEHGELITVKENATEEISDHQSEELTLNIVQEVPLEVTGELVLEDSDMKGELLVVDNSQNNNYNGDNVCLNASDVNIINDANFDSDNMNLVTVNEGGVSISTSNLEGTTVKLYQLDQSLVQIHSSGGQVTISKITSKMTANF